MLKEKMKQKETEQKQNVFCLIFLCFLKAKREEIKNNKYWKNKTDFSHTNVFFFTKRSETENVVFPTFFQESNNLFNFGYIKMESSQEENQS